MLIKISTPKNKTSWTADGLTFPIVDPHTKIKHLILQDYIKDWVVTICSNNRLNNATLTIIDSFCGGGLYKDEGNNLNLWEGSPFRLIKSVENGLREVKEKRSKPNFKLDIKFIFIDSDFDHIESLKKNLERSELAPYMKQCEFIQGEFSEKLDYCVSEVTKRTGNSFFFIDPFGYTQFTMNDLRKIMQVPKTEILLTFMIDFIRRFLNSRKDSLAKFDKYLEADGYFNSSNGNNIDSLSEQAYIRSETLRLFRDKTNVKYLYTFGMLPNKTLTKYYLIHFANKITAQKVIKDTLWVHNSLDHSCLFEYGIYGLGFRTPDYLEQNYRIFNIEENNKRKCISDLEDSILPSIHLQENGLPFEKILEETIQLNPASSDLYNESIIKLREENEIKVIREGKETWSKKIKNSDLIRKSKRTQYFLFDNLPSLLTRKDTH